MNTIELAAKQFEVLDKIPLGMCVIDHNYQVLFWNRCLCDWTKITKSEILGTPLTKHFPKLIEPSYQSRLSTIFQGGPPAIFSSQLHKHIFPARLPNAELRIQHTTVTSIPALSGDDHYALFAVEDVSALTKTIEEFRHIQEQANAEIEQRKAAENELIDANHKILAQQEALIEEERLKIMFQMTGATAHELNQPLMGLLGNIELMRLDKDDPNTVARHIDRIQEAGERISEIIRNFQLLGREKGTLYFDDVAMIKPDQAITILSVDDADEDFALIENLLHEHPQIRLVRKKNIATALQALKEHHFDLIFLDYALPDGTGLDFIQETVTNGVEIPVVVITGQGDEMIASQIIQAGAYDYLPKGRIRELSLIRVIANTLEKARLKKEIKNAQEKMAHMSLRDELTGLYNRRYFNTAIKSEVARAKRYDRDLVLGIMDLDHFKKINDTYGHPAGDVALAAIGTLLKDLFRQSDILCRYGGEEFAVILPDTQTDEARVVCERFRENVSKYQFKYKEIDFRLTISIGITCFTQNGDSKYVDEFVARADRALYQGKNEGRNKVISL
jgi:two-component system, cell cycle response regulator